ncbi:histidine kinase N-terminal 7TM domain-containing protein [Haloarchaeobius sp. TZWSO28]|uniref:histidine kinase N-terminal 7TM domain-containing protein n=1 Tax=Haloarchaeobius sp. TZWSO28 TaxID=3446119 RepID=UPI003EBC9A53
MPNTYVVALVIAGGISLALAVVGLRRSEAVGSRWFVLLLTSIAVWCLGNAVRYGQTDPEAFLFWYRVSRFGAQTAVALGLVFVLAYAGYDRWTRWPRVGLFVVPPLAMLTVVWLAPSMIWADTAVVRESPVLVMDFTYTPLFSAWYFLQYAQIAITLGVLVMVASRDQRLYRLQALTMLGGVMVPVFGNLLWWFGVSPVEHLDLSPFLLLVTGVSFAVSLFSFELLRVLPVARHTLVAEMQDGFVALDDDGRIVDANAAMAGILQRSMNDLVGEQFSAVVPDGGNGNTAERYPEDVVVTVAGERRHFDMRRTYVSENSDRTDQLLVFRDITARRRAEKRHSRLVEESSDLVTVFDHEGVIEYVSPSVRGVLGYDPNAIRRNSVEQFTHPEDRDRVWADIETVLSDPGGSVTFEHRLRRADGSWCLVESKARNLVEDPVIGGIVVNSRDITVREDRKRQLEAQNERLERFTSVVSHDLRNPLGVATGYLELGRQTGEDTAFEEVNDALKRMDRMIQDLLTLAREGRTIDDKHPVDLESVAREAWEAVPDSTGRLLVDVSDTVTADRQRLRELLENLFRNSVEHGSTNSRSETGDAVEHGSRNIRADPDDPPGVSVTIRETTGGFFVEDDGPGIPPEKRDAVFEFGHTSTESGTGFGLSIVSRIAEAHGWSVTLTESDAGGARFEFETDGPTGGVGEDRAEPESAMDD